jgi:hypothetical protein
MVRPATACRGGEASSSLAVEVVRVVRTGRLMDRFRDQVVLKIAGGGPANVPT